MSAAAKPAAATTPTATPTTPPSASASAATTTGSPSHHISAAAAAACAALSEDERKFRLTRLMQCFNACDIDKSGVIEAGELEIVVRGFHGPKANVKHEVKSLLAKFDLNNDSTIDANEWCTVCLELFAALPHDAFAKHCDKLLTVLQTCAAATAATVAAAAAAASQRASINGHTSAAATKAPLTAAVHT